MCRLFSFPSVYTFSTWLFIYYFFLFWGSPLLVPPSPSSSTNPCPLLCRSFTQISIRCWIVYHNTTLPLSDFPQERCPVVLAPLLYPEKRDILMDRILSDSGGITKTMMDSSLADFMQEVGYSFCSRLVCIRDSDLQWYVHSCLILANGCIKAGTLGLHMLQYMVKLANLEISSPYSTVQNAKYLLTAYLKLNFTLPVNIDFLILAQLALVIGLEYIFLFGFLFVFVFVFWFGFLFCFFFPFLMDTVPVLSF